MKTPRNGKMITKITHIVLPPPPMSSRRKMSPRMLNRSMIQEHPDEEDEHRPEDVEERVVRSNDHRRLLGWAKVLAQVIILIRHGVGNPCRPDHLGGRGSVPAALGAGHL